MTEFNTPTEAEMNAFQEIFAKMQNAMIAGSQLAREFAQVKIDSQNALDGLRQEVEGLRQEVQKVRSTNAALDDMLQVSRQARDRLSDELNSTRGERDNAVSERDTARADLSSAQRKADDLEGLLSSARTERDTAQLRVLELEEENESIKKQLAQVTEAMEAVQRALHPTVAVKEEPKPQPITEAEPAQTDTDIPQREGETTFQYYDRVGRYPSEREARAAAQPRSDDGKFQSEPVAASPKWDEGGWR